MTQNVWTDLDLSTGYTFTLTLTASDGTVTVTKTTGLTGTGTGVNVAWAVGELDIAVGTYYLNLRARETATSKDRDYRPGRPIRVNIVA